MSLLVASSLVDVRCMYSPPYQVSFDALDRSTAEAEAAQAAERAEGDESAESDMDDESDEEEDGDREEEEDFEGPWPVGSTVWAKNGIEYWWPAEVQSITLHSIASFPACSYPPPPSPDPGVRSL